MFDPNLKQKVFLIGISMCPEEDGFPPFCLNPEEEFGYAIEDFMMVKELAKQLEKVDEGRNTKYFSRVV